MKMSTDRLSGLFFLFLGIALYVAIIPAHVEPSQGGSIAPNTVPNFVAIVLSICGFLLAVKPTDYETQSPKYFGLALLYIVTISLGLYAISLFGFLIVAPILALVLMLLMGERRPLWLVAGTVGTPFTIWLFVAQFLDRSLP